MKIRAHYSMLCLLFLIGIQIGSVLAADTCPELVQRALAQVGEVCGGLGRNEACYGNNRLEAQLDLANGQPFANPADRTPVDSIRTLQTFALDEAGGTWGVAFLQIQANLPDTLPGQNVKFVLYGDVKLENAVTDPNDPFGPMQAFYFESGLKPKCKEAPTSSMVVQSPKGFEVTLRANGMDLKVGSTVAFTAEKNKRMRVTTLQGEVFATYDGKTQVIPQGFETTVELGGEDGLTPQGAPETAYLLDDEEWQVLADATGEITDEPFELLDTDQWSSIEDYCADPANAEICADNALADALTFETCPADQCEPLIDESSTDAGSACGDGVCAVDESSATCEVDCGAPQIDESVPEGDRSADTAGDDGDSGDDGSGESGGGGEDGDG